MSLLLVISDDVEAGLSSYLLSQVDQDTVTAGTLARARELLEERSWSAVILDTELSDGPGFDLLQFLAQINFENGVLVVSASRDKADKVRALEGGADDYVVRPYEPAEFMARVKALLRRSRRRTANGDVVRAGDVQLDVHTLEVALPGNRREHLTPNEMRLLHHLMTREGRVVEHEELVARLFGPHESPMSSKAIGVYVRRVRQKIEDDPDRPRYVVTVRGRGYRFDSRPEQPDEPILVRADFDGVADGLDELTELSADDAAGCDARTSAPA